MIKLSGILSPPVDVVTVLKLKPVPKRFYKHDSASPRVLAFGVFRFGKIDAGGNF